MLSDSTLAEWIQAHEVSWTLSPAAEMLHQDKAVVGSLLTLTARHGSAHVQPACEVCFLVDARLRTIVDAVLPADAGEIAYDIPPFGGTSPTDGGAGPAVTFTVVVARKAGPAQPARTGLEPCLRMIRSRLHALGARGPDGTSPVGRPPGSVS